MADEAHGNRGKAPRCNGVGKLPEVHHVLYASENKAMLEDVGGIDLLNDDTGDHQP